MGTPTETAPDALATLQAENAELRSEVQRWTDTATDLLGEVNPLRIENAELRERLEAAEGAREDVAAFLLDRADQYDTASPSWVGLADAAARVAAGDVEQLVSEGELQEEDLRRRVRSMAKTGAPGAGDLCLCGHARRMHGGPQNDCGQGRDGDFCGCARFRRPKGEKTE